MFRVKVLGHTNLQTSPLQRQVLLLKKISMKIFTERPYNSASEVERYLADESFFVLKNNQMIRLKNDKKSVVEALADKQNIMKSFFKAQKSKFNRDEDLIKTVEHYDIS
jgi:hypothetical protein